MPAEQTLEVTTGVSALIQQSQYRETVMLVVIVIVCVGYILEKVLKFVQARRSNEKTTTAQIDRDLEEARIASIRVITTKDGDGNFVLLTLPRLFRELIGEIRIGNEHLTNLTNHQSEMTAKIVGRLDKIEQKQHRE